MLTACRCALLVVYLPPGNGKLKWGQFSEHTNTAVKSQSNALTLWW